MIKNQGITYLGLGSCPVRTASISAKAQVAVSAASTLTTCVHPTVIYHNTMETHQIARRPREVCANDKREGHTLGPIFMIITESIYHP